MNKIIISLCALFVHHTDALQGISVFKPRSIGSNNARILTGWNNHITDSDAKKSQYSLATTLAYTHSFNGSKIADTLFGQNRLTFAGSQVAERSEDALIADNFGLSPRFQSTISLKPIIQTTSVYLDFFARFDNLIRGFFVQCILPFGHTSWYMHVNELINPQSENSVFPAGYMTNDATTLAPTFTSAAAAIAGNKSFGAAQGLANSRIIHESSLTTLSNVTFSAGLDLWSKSESHCALFAILSAPTPKKPTSSLLFEPRLGTRQCNVGIGLSGHTTVWTELEQELRIYTTIHATHGIGIKERRTFDLRNNEFASRYLLLKEFDNTKQFTGKVIPAANVTTLLCRADNIINLDAAFMAEYIYQRIVLDFGYNGWISSKEKVDLKEDFPSAKYGIKGVQNTFDTITNSEDNRTQTSATITSGLFDDQNTSSDVTTTFLSIADINVKSAATPLLITHKLFGYIGYTAEISKEQSFFPFVGAGIECEFQGSPEKFVDQPNRTTLSTWTLYVKCGTTF